MIKARWSVLWLAVMSSSIALCSNIDTIDTHPVFYERGTDGTVRFFYDDHYYLVDKHCEFKAIERVSSYDFQQQMFVGGFTDFDSQGKVILEGYYENGRKQGDFRAYHPNGQLKWQVSYSNGVAQGILSFFYPDGKPLLQVSHTGGGARILNFWDRQGRQRVTDGEGRYEFSVLADGYNEFGYIRYNRKGKVVDGYPHGNWSIEYIFDDGKKRNAGYELYHKGRFIQGYEAYTDEPFSDTSRYGILPIDFSNGAEAMIAKGCTIDEYTGFTEFLAVHLSEWFSPDQLSEEAAGPFPIEFLIQVRRNGEPRNIDIKATFDNKQYADLLYEALRGITYWIPSYAAGEYIDDTFSVTMEAFLDLRYRKMQFYNIAIRRAGGI
ncbi:toxin-antitoxin system YwqK family antitoxin [Parapedobacter soli]|uniref:toxin-antitoxin system YwqK family antitoxin n=1 Tax=Parapedobacter soli TaxID=416955 RepID=UPI0021C6C647|nr:hypothetical protein [Parapedobacter soli]